MSIEVKKPETYLDSGNEWWKEQTRKDPSKLMIGNLIPFQCSWYVDEVGRFNDTFYATNPDDLILYMRDYFDGFTVDGITHAIIDE